MKKFAYHRLRLPSGEHVEGPVVVTMDANMHLIEWHILVAEESMVEWLGGTLDCDS